jgi:hypothetical protein
MGCATVPASRGELRLIGEAGRLRTFVGIFESVSSHRLPSLLTALQLYFAREL